MCKEWRDLTSENLPWESHRKALGIGVNRFSDQLSSRDKYRHQLKTYRNFERGYLHTIEIPLASVDIGDADRVIFDYHFYGSDHLYLLAGSDSSFVVYKYSISEESFALMGSLEGCSLKPQSLFFDENHLIVLTANGKLYMRDLKHANPFEELILEGNYCHLIPLQCRLESGVLTAICYEPKYKEMAILCRELSSKRQSQTWMKSVYDPDNKKVLIDQDVYHLQELVPVSPECTVVAFDTKDSLRFYVYNMAKSELVNRNDYTIENNFVPMLSTKIDDKTIVTMGLGMFPLSKIQVNTLEKTPIENLHFRPFSSQKIEVIDERHVVFIGEDIEGDDPDCNPIRIYITDLKTGKTVKSGFDLVRTIPQFDNPEHVKKVCQCALKVGMIAFTSFRYSEMRQKMYIWDFNASLD